jgi:phosphopantothenoylcysteine synthetase/decarboxylase
MSATENGAGNESSSTSSVRPRLKILLAVTGSVAAVKGPEIAVRLAVGVNADVRVLLTRGGQNFWSKAEAYNQKYWGIMQDLMEQSDLSDEAGKGEKGTISVYCKFSH